MPPEHNCISAHHARVILQTASAPPVCNFAHMVDEREKVQQMLAEALEKTGLDPTNLARLIGVSPSTLTRVRNKDPKHTLGGRTLLKLAAVIGGEIEAPGPREPPRLPPSHEMPRDIPVYGTAMGANGDGAFTINLMGEVDRARRGPGIMNSRGVFAIYVEGESMAPRFEPGELVYLDENRPIRVGDDVVLVVESPMKGEPPRSYLKRLVRRTADRWICEQFNPPKTVEFDVASLKGSFRVLRLHEVMGS